MNITPFLARLGRDDDHLAQFFPQGSQCHEPSPISRPMYEKIWLAGPANAFLTRWTVTANREGCDALIGRLSSPFYRFIMKIEQNEIVIRSFYVDCRWRGKGFIPWLSSPTPILSDERSGGLGDAYTSSVPLSPSADTFQPVLLNNAHEDHEARQQPKGRRFGHLRYVTNDPDTAVYAHDVAIFQHPQSRHETPSDACQVGRLLPYKSDDNDTSIPGTTGNRLLV
ncbi:uncharacterized protein ARMOST_02625 [Armillaria ostoyae]|uniref:Uncharacterized protein n=1 Tax=Armillaria ostoyae TaxID=47428 RepID=A0A284QS75_ARMOS|nr:uncharacterized protein ARMOST_02625 [Armillaria ostoyae]